MSNIVNSHFTNKINADPQVNTYTKLVKTACKRYDRYKSKNYRPASSSNGFSKKILKLLRKMLIALAGNCTFAFCFSLQKELQTQLYYIMNN